ncbi:hypothetical protein LR48_Vigan09g112200 [Vigna angularis]|uniref:HR-like lesion-inducer n=1 Tax=Phaseolus angularis TaxID=3914 RepID=A0A0L9VBU2_PHAAN|nr:hypothetical protein LR48_Vigan09g112200 [Vigna angularis]
MGFSSFLGRLLFASLFILSAWQMFVPDTLHNTRSCEASIVDDLKLCSDIVAKELIPKLAAVRRNLSSKLGLAVSDINVRPVIASTIFLKGVGGILFVLGSTFGSYLLLFYLGLSTPILYDFYNYRPNNPQYSLLLSDFIQNTALCGALLFFIEMKYLITRKQIWKKTPKAKTV